MEQTEDKKEILLLSAPKQEVTAQDAVVGYNNRSEPRKVIKIFRDKTYGTFELLGSDRPQTWWVDDITKVNKLIEAFKKRAMVKQALVYGGISARQWQDFNDVHEDFQRVKQACEQIKILQALDVMDEAIVVKRDWNAALALLKNTHPDYSNKLKVDLGEPLKPTINNNVNIGTVVNINSGEIAEALRQIAREVLGPDEGDPTAIVNETLAEISSGQSK